MNDGTGKRSRVCLSGWRFSVLINCDRSSHTLLLVMLSCFAWYGCQFPSPTSGQHPQLGTSLPCAQIEADIDMQDRIETLRDIARAYYKGCDETVITYGTKAQTDYRYKTFSVVKEISNIFLPDGTLIDYVLESYERGFLTVLLAASYSNSNNPEAVKVELRRLDHEIFTPLYNYGADPVNLLFSAVLWEVIGEPDEAWVDWNRLQAQEYLDGQIRAFAGDRLTQLNSREDLAEEWTIYAIGRFPGIDWTLEFTDLDRGYFSVTPQQGFLPGCSSASGVRISTHSWFQKIAMRHSRGYHPLLHAQTWLRLPVGVAYSITTFASGASLAIGGCLLDASAEGDGALCEVSLKGGMALMLASPKVLEHTLRPDLRHWDNVPSSFLFTTAPDVQEDPCFTSLSDQDQRLGIKIFGRAATTSAPPQHL